MTVKRSAVCGRVRSRHLTIPLAAAVALGICAAPEASSPGLEKAAPTLGIERARPSLLPPEFPAVGLHAPLFRPATSLDPMGVHFVEAGWPHALSVSSMESAKLPALALHAERIVEELLPRIRAAFTLVSGFLKNAGATSAQPDAVVSAVLPTYAPELMAGSVVNVYIAAASAFFIDTVQHQWMEGDVSALANVDGDALRIAREQDFFSRGELVARVRFDCDPDAQGFIEVDLHAAGLDSGATVEIRNVETNRFDAIDASAPLAAGRYIDDAGQVELRLRVASPGVFGDDGEDDAAAEIAIDLLSLRVVSALQPL